MSLATIRAHIWKGGSDVVMYYKATGRRKLKPRPPPASTMLLEEESRASARPAATPVAVSEAGSSRQAS